MSRSLLDVNVLLALLDSDHVDHERAHRWLDANVSDGWASCPITENGFVRIIAQPRYPSPITPMEAIELLDQARSTDLHEFWPCEVSLLDPSLVISERLHGSRQVTDAYLLALAVKRGGRFVTFDRSVALAAVRGAGSDHLLVVP